ncbi:hypothetical protein [Peribacillus sp. SI8-4]|uniref:hypothetical protein n=1 Tax=Peribacillus sp. SI8-4 TaxID=3048009 RepID=UPI002552A941|nr:hypothetical protein [Peribacillus sp. SI8-4]
MVKGEFESAFGMCSGQNLEEVLTFQVKERQSTIFLSVAVSLSKVHFKADGDNEFMIKSTIKVKVGLGGGLFTVRAFRKAAEAQTFWGCQCLQ